LGFCSLRRGKNEGQEGEEMADPADDPQGHIFSAGLGPILFASANLSESQERQRRKEGQKEGDRRETKETANVTLFAVVDALFVGGEKAEQKTQRNSTLAEAAGKGISEPLFAELHSKDFTITGRAFFDWFSARFSGSSGRPRRRESDDVEAEQRPVRPAALALRGLLSSGVLAEREQGDTPKKGGSKNGTTHARRRGERDEKGSGSSDKLGLADARRLLVEEPDSVLRLHSAVIAELCSDDRVETENERRVFAAAAAHELVGPKAEKLVVNRADLEENFVLVPDGGEAHHSEGNGPRRLEEPSKLPAPKVVVSDSHPPESLREPASETAPPDNYTLITGPASDTDANRSDSAGPEEEGRVPQNPVAAESPTTRSQRSSEGEKDQLGLAAAPLDPRELYNSAGVLEVPKLPEMKPGLASSLRFELEHALQCVRLAMKSPGTEHCRDAEENILHCLLMLDGATHAHGDGDTTSEGSVDVSDSSPYVAGPVASRIDGILSRIDQWEDHARERDDRIRKSLTTVQDHMAADARIEEFVGRRLSSLSPLRSVVCIQRHFRRRKQRLVTVKWRKLVQQWRDHPESKPLRNRAAAVQELIDTERNYVRGLATLCDSYVVGLRDAAGSTNSRDVGLVFSNVEILRRCHETMLAELVAGNDPGKSIAHGFVMLAPFLKIYTQYVNGYEGALVALERLKLGSAFRDALRGIQSEAYKVDMSYGLENLLIAPIQRMPRYNLLLQEIIKLTPDEHRDRAPLEQALAHIRAVNEHINEHKKRMENLERVLQIQRKLTFSYGGGGGLAGAVGHEGDSHSSPQQNVGGTAEMMIVEPHRIWVREGYLSLCRADSLVQSSVDRASRRISRAPASPTNLYCFLFNDIFVYTSVPETWTEWASTSRPSSQTSLPEVEAPALVASRVHRAPNAREQEAQPHSFQFRGFFSLDTVTVEKCVARMDFPPAGASSSSSSSASASASALPDTPAPLSEKLLADLLRHVLLRFSCAQCGRETLTIERPTPTHFTDPDRFVNEWKDLVGLSGACSRESCPDKQSALCTFVDRKDHSAVASINCGTADEAAIAGAIASVIQRKEDADSGPSHTAAASGAVLSGEVVAVPPDDVDRCFVLKHTPRIGGRAGSQTLVYCHDAQECQDWVEALQEQISSLRRPEAIAEPLVGGDHLKKVICDGWLVKQGAWFSTWRRRFFRLRGQTLFYYVTASESANPDPRGLVNLERYRLAVPTRLVQGAVGNDDAAASAHSRRSLRRRSSRAAIAEGAANAVVVPGAFAVSTLDTLFSSFWGEPEFVMHLIHEEANRRRYILVAETEPEFRKWVQALSTVVQITELRDDD
jgi:RhoGEF domain/PH domain